MFSEEKLAQAVAVLMRCAPGHQLDKLKMVKLLYLSDRRAIVRLGATITGDNYVSMPHGPVPSQSLNVVNGDFERDGAWDKWIIDSGRYLFGLSEAGANRAITALSAAEVALLQQIWSEFGHMDRWQIRDWTHANCAEWRDPAGSSLPITLVDMAVGAGLSPDQARRQVQQIQEQESLDRLLASL